MHRYARIITCLHHPKSGLGEPSMLPIINCDVYQENGRPVSIALISTKQPVPRCPPQQDLNVLIELQLSIDEQKTNSNQLKSYAWVKLPLFDKLNRLLSGRWRAKLRKLPIRADASLEKIPEVYIFNRVKLAFVYWELQINFFI